MTLNDVTEDLLRCLGNEPDGVLGPEQIAQWPDGAFEVLQKAGWIKPAAPAATVECPGCEENCFMPVHVFPAQQGQPAGAYVVCDRRNDMGRVKVPLARLKQWQVTQAQIARWVSEELGLTLKSYNPTNIGTIKLGNLRHGGRLSSVEFHSDEPVRLTISGSALPLTEIVFLEDGRLQIDQVAIAHIVGQAHAPTRSGRRKPSTARRDARKLDTAARHQSWRKEARELRRAHRDKSERWIAQRIAKLPIADGASWETIRKNIRK